LATRLGELVLQETFRAERAEQASVFRVIKITRCAMSALDRVAPGPAILVEPPLAVVGPGYRVAVGQFDLLPIAVVKCVTSARCAAQSGAAAEAAVAHPHVRVCEVDLVRRRGSLVALAAWIESYVELHPTLLIHDADACVTAHVLILMNAARSLAFITARAHNNT